MVIQHFFRVGWITQLQFPGGPDYSCSYFSNYYSIFRIINLYLTPTDPFKMVILRLPILEGRFWTWAAVTSGDPRGIFERASLVPSKSLTVEIWRFNLFAHLRDTDGEKYISPDLGVECSNTFWSREEVQPPVAPDSFSRPPQAEAGSTKLATLVSDFIEHRKKPIYLL